MRMFFSIIGMVLALAANGFGGERIRVACIGDSITYGSTIPNRERDCYPTQLQKLLGDHYEVRNFGNPGRGIIQTSRRGKTWRAFIKQKEHFQALEFNPDVVICNLGINDMGAWDQGHAAEFLPDYLELLEAYKELPSHPKIFIWTRLAPLFPEHGYYHSATPFLMRLDLEKVAEQTGAVGLDLFSELAGRHDLFQTKDGIHPNAAGYAEIARLTYGQIKPYLTGNFGGLKLPYIYGDHMVFQRNKALRIQGTANAGQKVEVRFAGKKGDAIADSKGRWEVRLPAMEAGGPFVLEVEAEAEKTLRFEDVMVGEVWLAAGQSNMEFPLKDCWGGKKTSSDATDAGLRLLDRQRTVPKGKVAWSTNQLENCTAKRFYKGQWVACNPESSAGFSGVAYFFAQRLRKELQVPVGIIHVAIGGAPIEAFISESAMLSNSNLLPEVVCNGYWFNNDSYPDWVRSRAKQQLDHWISNPSGALPGHPFAPSFLYRAAIQPLEQFPIRGVLWYQGESNAARADGRPYPYGLVRAGLETLITDWRRQFGQGDFPFLYVQLPNYARDWMVFRQMQLDVSRKLPDIGMAVAIDVGDPKTVHPRNKRPVGDRLARIALAKTYGKPIACSGPAYRRFSVEGNQLRVFFDSAEGLQTTDGKPPRTFELAGKDGEFHPAQATIDGASVVLQSPEVSGPTAVRYAWAPNPAVNLVNAAGLPAGPFRSDP